jgi:predicted nucleotidyltransferase
MTLLDTLQEKRVEILQVAARHGAFNVRVFGSVVQGEETPESDIDFLVDYGVDIPGFRIPIDHCLVSPTIQMVNNRIGRDLGSDHYPVICELEPG